MLFSDDVIVRGARRLLLKQILQRDAIEIIADDPLQPLPHGQGGACATLPMWEGLERVIRNYLDGITLQDLLEQQTARAANDYVI